MDVWLEPKDCARITKLAYRTVLGAIRNGELEAAGFGVDGGAPYRVRPASLDAWFQGRLVARRLAASVVNSRARSQPPSRHALVSAHGA
jgi:hypothetical protein